MNKTLLLIGAVFGLLTVLLGAFGAHAFHSELVSNGRLDTYQTAVRYQEFHAVALLVLGILAKRIHTKYLKYSGYLIAVGTVFFSGSLYLLSLLNLSAFGAIAPIGGTLLIAGWACLVVAIFKYDANK